MSSEIFFSNLRNPDIDLGQKKYFVEAVVLRLQEDPPNFTQRRELREIVQKLRDELSTFSFDVEKHAALIELYTFTINTYERLAEPALEITENFLQVERGSATDFRLLIQSEFAAIGIDEVEPFDFSVLLLTEPSTHSKESQQLRIRSSIFNLPQVTSYWMDVSKANILLLMQGGSEGKHLAARVLATIKAWEQIMTNKVGVEIGVKVSGLVCMVTEKITE